MALWGRRAVERIPSVALWSRRAVERIPSVALWSRRAVERIPSVALWSHCCRVYIRQIVAVTFQDCRGNFPYWLSRLPPRLFFPTKNNTTVELRKEC